MAASTSKPAYRIFPDYAKEGGYKVSRERAEEYAYRLVAVDPGGVHVGVAVFGCNNSGWSCFWAGEMQPEEFEDWLSEHMVHSGIDILVVEQFTLYADKAMEQTGSDMPTSQLIGAIKYIWRQMKGTASRWPRPDVELHFQPAKIKVPTQSVLKNRGMKSMAKTLKAGGHAFDAELHGYHHIINTMDEPIHSLD